MKVLIIEDEHFSAERLKQQLLLLNSEIQVLDVLDSVKSSIDWFSKNDEPDLIFLDIHLADKNSFEIFKEVNITAPIIFTTAYNQYAIQAFKVNSIDYLLKPIDVDELKIALEKYENLYLQEKKENQSIDTELLQSLLQKPNYKNRFLVKKGSQFESIQTENIAYFFSENKLTSLVTQKGNRYLIDQSLEELSSLLNPVDFFRINRQMILRIDSVVKIHTFFNGRLKLEIVHQDSKEEIFVSRERVQAFKEWLD